METTFIPGRMTVGPECDSGNIVFPKARLTEEADPLESVALFELWLRRIPERLRGGRDERRGTTRKRLISTSRIYWSVLIVLEKLEFSAAPHVYERSADKRSSAGQRFPEVF